MIFILKKAYSCMGQDFRKKQKHFFRFEISLPQADKQKRTSFVTKRILQYFKTLKDMITGTASNNFFFKVDKIMLKYGNLMLPAWHILNLYCVRLLNAAPFYENYTKRGGVKFLQPIFQKKVPFLAIIERCPVLCFSCKNTFVGAGNLEMITSKF